MAKTKLTPKQLFERRNTSDIFDRQVIVGLLRILNRKLVYEQVWNDDTDGIENITVPFFYDFGGSNISSERFIQDNYIHFTDDECTEIGLKKIDGNFDFYPQGRISLSSVGIDSGNMTNRFAMAQYTRWEDGKMRSYTSYLYSIPLQFQFVLEVRCDNMNTMFKIDEACRKFFYKIKTFHFNYNGTVVPCRVGFPESAMQLNANSTFTMGQAPSDNWHKLSMTIQCETYMPDFDEDNAIPSDTSINSFGTNIWVNNTYTSKPHRGGPIEWVTDFENLVLVNGQDIMLEWKNNFLDKDLLTVDITYQIEGDETEYMIDSIDNHHHYHWYVPYDFTDNEPIDIMIPNTDEVQMTTTPEIYIYPDPTTHLVEPSNVYVKNRGFFIAPKTQYQTNAIISYVNKNDEIVETNAVLNLSNFMIDEQIPMEFECFAYDKEIKPLRIRLIVKDHCEKNLKAVSPWFTVI